MKSIYLRNLKKFTPYTREDIYWVRDVESDHEVRTFKRNLIVELKENYECGFRDIADLLNDKVMNVKSIYNHVN